MNPYPTELHNTHLIPSIQMREKGVSPVPISELKKDFNTKTDKGYIAVIDPFKGAQHPSIVLPLLLPV